ncbi:MAG TPA: hypothetical protein VFX64_05585 [Candidatus Nitrosotalea sp.]|nr:hypothetical protein [Candidatus Nitrosotalea sp.]
MAEKGPQPNPLMALSIQEVTGHLAWGLVAGAVTLSLRYTILNGLFAILIDSDHLVGLTHLDAISRMSHSIAFGVIAAVILILVFRKNYLLGAIAFSGMLAHLSYDTFAGEDGMFPIFAPFYNHQISFSHTDWLYFEISAIILVGIVTIFAKKEKTTVSL